MMEVFATQSPYAFGKIRVWGTIGYSVGVQIAGWVYHQFSPQAVYYTVLITILLSIFCLSAVRMKKKETVVEKEKTPCLYSSSSSQWTLSLLYCVDWLASGVGNIGHTYILSYSWIVVYQFILPPTVVAISVVVEAPLIFSLIDSWTTGLYGF